MERTLALAGYLAESGEKKTHNVDNLLLRESMDVIGEKTRLSDSSLPWSCTCCSMRLSLPLGCMPGSYARHCVGRWRVPAFSQAPAVSMHHKLAVCCSKLGTSAAGIFKRADVRADQSPTYKV